jgi:hypothetical protein
VRLRRLERNRLTEVEGAGVGQIAACKARKWRFFVDQQ